MRFIEEVGEDSGLLLASMAQAMGSSLAFCLLRSYKRTIKLNPVPGRGKRQGLTPFARSRPGQVKSVPYVPVSHPFVERLIGTIRREYLDRMFFWNAVDLARKLGEFKAYYNSSRCHQSLRGDTPLEKSGKHAPRRASLGRYDWQQHCHGLFQLPMAAENTNSPRTG